MTTFAKRSGMGLVFTLAFTLAACSGSGSGSDDPVQPPPTGTTGFFNLSVSDAPIKDAAKVCVAKGLHSLLCCIEVDGEH